MTAAAEGIRALVAWAVETRDADATSLPPAVLARSATILADDMAAMIGARDEPEVHAFQQRTLSRATSTEATVFRGGRHRTDRLSAAVANAVAGDWLELDEGYRPVPCHAGLYVVPALLANTEMRALPAGNVLRCLAIAYEIVTRVARTWPPRVFNVHSHARYSAVGAAAATSLAVAADADLMHRALTAAATLVNAGPRNHLLNGALVRNVWPALGAWSGMMAVEWAECGIGGAEDGFGDVYQTVFGSEPRAAELTDGLDASWAVLDGYTKVFACCQHLHSTVEAALDIRAQVLRDGGLERITRIAVDTHPLAVVLANPSPTTTLGAKFSLPHAVAATLVTGSGGADAFASSTVRDATIGTLRAKVTIAEYEHVPAPPDDRPARVRIDMADGRSITGECLSAQGGRDRPFSDDIFSEKLRALTEPVYPRFMPVMETLMRLDQAQLARPWPDIVAELCESWTISR